MMFFQNEELQFFLSMMNCEKEKQFKFGFGIELLNYLNKFSILEEFLEYMLKIYYNLF